jgi:hypothetical protein
LRVVVVEVELFGRDFLPIGAARVDLVGLAVLSSRIRRPGSLPATLLAEEVPSRRCQIAELGECFVAVAREL